MANQTETTEIKLYKTIKHLFEQVAKEQGHVLCFDAIDIGITVSKMTEEQQEDLLTMIKFMSNLCTSTAGSVLDDVVHDLNGLKAGFLDLPEGRCFSPRSFGIAKRVAALS